MIRLTDRFLKVACLTLMLAVVGGCSGAGQALKTEFANDPSEIAGRYNLVLFSDGTYNGLEVLAILSAAGSGHAITPYAPTFNYTVTNNIGSREALAMAIAFVKQNPAFTQAQISKILDPTGKTIGFEVRPLFAEFQFGYANVMEVAYFLQADGSVQASINLRQAVKKLFYGGGRN